MDIEYFREQIERRLEDIRTANDTPSSKLKELAEIQERVGDIILELEDLEPGDVDPTEDDELTDEDTSFGVSGINLQDITND